MKRALVVAIALSVVVAVGSTGAAERQARVRTVDESDRVVVLADGTKLWLAEGLVVNELQEGITVKLSYEKRDGKHVVTWIETAE